MEHFTPIASLCGGVFIGLSASLLLLSDGKIAGISSILGGLLSPKLVIRNKERPSCYFVNSIAENAKLI
jgi:uncharacterized membrane protein YedE/YeeE